MTSIPWRRESWPRNMWRMPRPSSGCFPANFKLSGAATSDGNGMGLAQGKFDRHFPRSAEEGHSHGIAGLMAIHHLGNILGAGHLVAVDADNQIATQIDRRVAQVGFLVTALQSRSLCRASRDD